MYFIKEPIFTFLCVAVNVDNTVGSIGFISRIIPAVYPISIIKVDPQTGEPIRDARGLCIPCKPNEPGVFIGKIIPNNPSRAFLGYVDEEASKKKVVCDVFRKGDKAFLSGTSRNNDYKQKIQVLIYRRYNRCGRIWEFVFQR